MRLCILCWFILITGLFGDDVFRVSHVHKEEGEGRRAYELKSEAQSDVFFVDEDAIIGSEDVKSVGLSPAQLDALSIVLTEEGGRKMGEATQDGFGVKRLAVILDGELVLAPVVRSKLGGNFIIEGLKEYEPREIQVLAWRIEGKTPEEIDELLVGWEAPQIKSREERPVVYHTEEEYQALKKKRERHGVYYLGRVYDSEELDAMLREGMTQQEVEQLLGRPGKRRSLEDGVVEYDYSVAPERKPMERSQHISDFSVEFKKGRLVRLRSKTYSDEPRQGKAPEQPKGNLQISTPKVDMSAEDFDMVRFIELSEVSLKEGADKPSIVDYAQMLSLLHTAEQLNKDAEIEANCSILVFLAMGFPEVEELRKKADGGKIALSDLDAVIKPYYFGEKPWPEQ